MRGKQQYVLALGEHLKTTTTDLLEMPFLILFFVAATGGYKNSLSSDETFTAMCWVSKCWISKLEDSWKKNLGLDLQMLHLLHYTIV